MINFQKLQVYWRLCAPSA